MFCRIVLDLLLRGFSSSRSGCDSMRPFLKHGTELVVITTEAKCTSRSYEDARASEVQVDKYIALWYCRLSICWSLLPTSSFLISGTCNSKCSSNYLSSLLCSARSSFPLYTARESTVTGAQAVASRLREQPENSQTFFRASIQAVGTAMASRLVAVEIAQRPFVLSCRNLVVPPEQRSSSKRITYPTTVAASVAVCP